jgi:hypothetical protein
MCEIDDKLIGIENMTYAFRIHALLRVVYGRHSDC